MFFTYLSAFFQNLKILSPFLPSMLAFDAQLSLFCRLNLVVINYMQDRHKFFHPSFMISFSGNGRTLSRKLATLPLLPYRICHSPASYPLAPISVPWKICTENTKNIKKYLKNHFRPFFPPSDISLFHTR